MFSFAGFHPFSKNETKLIFDQQRLKYCENFVKSMKGLSNKRTDSGVLFTGPNGVGKSSICLATFVMCFIQSLPVVYIPRSDQWEAGSDTVEEARSYFMTAFFGQNADIIAKDPLLFPFFKDQLVHGRAHHKNYFSFAESLMQDNARPCGFIADEVQKLTMAAYSTEDRKLFFAKDFTIWTGPSGYFASQLCASVYGLREFDLPSGEASRLRFVLPFGEATAKALMRDFRSPFHVPHATDDLLNELFMSIGGMPLVLSTFAEIVAGAESITAVTKALISFNRLTRVEYYEKCEKTFIRKAADKAKSVITIFKVLRGEQFFEMAMKELYDYGLCYVDPKTERVLVVNKLAECALQEIFSDFALQELPRISAAHSGTAGYIFEANLQICIIRHGCSLNVVPMQMRGDTNLITQQIPFKADAVDFFSSPFSELNAIPKDIKSDRESSILWMSSNPNYPCDGIIIPATRDKFSPIIIFDASVTHPYDRPLSKLNSLTILRMAVMDDLRFKGKEVIIVLCFHENIDSKICKRDSHPYIYTLDRSELAKIGVKF